MMQAAIFACNSLKIDLKKYNFVCIHDVMYYSWS